MAYIGRMLHASWSVVLAYLPLRACEYLLGEDGLDTPPSPLLGTITPPSNPDVAASEAA